MQRTISRIFGRLERAQTGKTNTKKYIWRPITTSSFSCRSASFSLAWAAAAAASWISMNGFVRKEDTTYKLARPKNITPLNLYWVIISWVLLILGCTSLVDPWNNFSLSFTSGAKAERVRLHELLSHIHLLETSLSGTFLIILVYSYWSRWHR